MRIKWDYDNYEDKFKIIMLCNLSNRSCDLLVWDARWARMSAPAKGMQLLQWVDNIGPLYKSTTHLHLFLQAMNWKVDAKNPGPTYPWMLSVETFKRQVQSPPFFISFLSPSTPSPSLSFRSEFPPRKGRNYWRSIIRILSRDDLQLLLKACTKYHPGHSP